MAAVRSIARTATRRRQQTAAPSFELLVALSAARVCSSTRHGQQARTLTTTTARARTAATATRALSASASPAHAHASSAAAQVASQLGLPCFPAHSDQLHLLPSPSAFHDALLALIASAQSRLVLSSLYIGPTEAELIHTHLRAALSRNPQLRCTLLLDALRSTREGFARPSAASLVAALVRDFPEQVDARLHLTPRATSALVRKLLPKRFGEGLGLQHMKLYLADDSLIISGANLSRDYFTNRQDRYMLIRDHQPLGDYMHDLVVQRFARHAYRLDAVHESSSSQFSGDERNAEYRLTWDGGERSEQLWRASTAAGKQKARPVEYSWGSSLSDDLRALTSAWAQSAPPHRSEDAERGGAADVELVPLLQLGTVGLSQETDALQLLLSQHLDAKQREGDGRTTIDLTTGYFSPSPSLVRLLLRQNGESRSSLLLRILTAAPRANGFFGSSFPSGLLPAAYVLLERAFAKKAQTAGWRESAPGEKDGGPRRVLEMRRWEKPGWTYHAKGIWITPPSSSHPQITLLGSSNYGRRSSNLDAECTLLISASPSSAFTAKLAAERDALLQDARAWEWDESRGGGAGEGVAGRRRQRERERQEEAALGIQLDPLVRVLTWLLKGLL
ncbi:CDP-diacylglycerol--glycerol-3-phosphate 3-phosphatidyltransferase [Tilletia horrida]|nr:CDP-diacylglycerol--glycerol-3-phosphate 3-phosphatidyltransferase [Tilletia horrida]